MTLYDMIAHVSMRRCFKSLMSRDFRRSYLKVNKVSKSESTRKLEYAYHFWKCADGVYVCKVIKISLRFSKLQLANFDVFLLRHSVCFIVHVCLATLWPNVSVADGFTGW